VIAAAPLCPMARSSPALPNRALWCLVTKSKDTGMKRRQRRTHSSSLHGRGKSRTALAMTGGGGELTRVHQLGPRGHQTRKGKHGDTEGIMGKLTER
jgi:hypothetical protein